MFSRNKSTDVDQDWVASTSDLIEGVIDKVRDGAVVKLTTIVRAIVYGSLMAVVGSAALVIFSVLFVRFLDIYLDYIPGVPENVWFADFIAGALFVLAGALAWSKRSPKRAEAKGAR